MKIIILTILLFNFVPCISQNLTLDEVVSLRKQNIAVVEETLTEKNWSLIEVKEPTEQEMGTVIFAFKKRDYNDDAQAFFKFYYSDETGTQRVSIQLNKKEFYDNYIARIKSLGCTLKDSKLSDGSIRKIYAGKTVTFEVSIITKKNGYSETRTIYEIFILTNEDYTRNFSEE